MRRLELSAEADADLEDILAFGIDRFGEEVATAYVRSFQESFDLLLDFPQAGPPASRTRRRVRSKHHRSHRIIYKVIGQTIRIVRIFHQSRNIDDLLNDIV